MIYTIKDLSKELKIDKQKIYRYIKKEKIEALGVSSEAPHETPCEGELIDVLKAQIRSLEQDKENLQNIIDNQQKTLEQTQVLFSQEQALHLSLQNKVLQIETKTTEEISNYESELEELKKELEEEKNKGFFSRLFKK